MKWSPLGQVLVWNRSIIAVINRNACNKISERIKWQSNGYSLRSDAYILLPMVAFK